MVGLANGEERMARSKSEIADTTIGATTARRAVKRILIIVLIVCAGLYAVDFLSLRLRIPRRDMLGAVTVHTYYAVKLKSGKTEYDYAGDHNVDCSNSMFPQLRVEPCWYVSRHTNQQITIDSGNPNNPKLF